MTINNYFSKNGRWTILPVIDFTYEYFPKGLFRQKPTSERHLIGLEVRWIRHWAAIEIQL